ncbi:ABC transporter permease [Synechococcus sp. CBW1108]|jgi:glycine betaine/proline transport system permease protein|uniref:ABC transporter permease n=1 Tax=Synechococcus sp. CBW1108 TaxID=1353147 RepID=UPI00351C2FC7
MPLVDALPMPAQLPGRLPLGSAAEPVVVWLLEHAQPLFNGVFALVDGLTQAVESLLLLPPPWLACLLIFLLGIWRLGAGFGLAALLALALVVGLGLWSPMVATLALVLSATAICVLLGFPLGILAARSERAWGLLRPLLDLMQTMPAFVYLIPAVMFFGTGKVPGTIATVIFAMPPAVRLTRLGIQEVSADLIEAGLAFGCTPGQLLRRVQIPAALPTLMTGLNQTIMLALSMVVIASMIGAGGLGDMVLRGIQQLDLGLGIEGGLAVVILAVLLDRLGQSFACRPRSMGQRLRELARLWGVWR